MALAREPGGASGALASPTTRPQQLSSNEQTGGREDNSGDERWPTEEQQKIVDDVGHDAPPCCAKGQWLAPPQRISLLRPNRGKLAKINDLGGRCGNGATLRAS